MTLDIKNMTIIKNELLADNKADLFDELALLLYDNNYISNKKLFLEDIMYRESLGITSTDGIAYPHSKSKHVIRPGIAVGIKRCGLEYGDEEGVKPTVFFMIASPEKGADIHIYILQELFGKFSEEFIENINKANNENEIMEILCNS
jgi:fructose PTS system EIIA component